MTHLPDHLKDCGKTPEALGIMDFDLSCLDAGYGHKVGPMAEGSQETGSPGAAAHHTVEALPEPCCTGGVESRLDKRPNLSDLRWSGAIEQDADVVMFVYREAYYLSKRDDDPDREAVRHKRLVEVRNKIEVIVEKNRGGPAGTVDLFCDIACAVIRDLDRNRRDMP